MNLDQRAQLRRAIIRRDTFLAGQPTIRRTCPTCLGTGIGVDTLPCPDCNTITKLSGEAARVDAHPEIASGEVHIPSPDATVPGEVSATRLAPSPDTTAVNDLVPPPVRYGTGGDRVVPIGRTTTVNDRTLG